MAEVECFGIFGKVVVPKGYCPTIDMEIKLFVEPTSVSNFVKFCEMFGKVNSIDTFYIVCLPERQLDFRWIAVKYLSNFKYDFISPKLALDSDPDDIAIFASDLLIWIEPNSIDKLIEKIDLPNHIWISANIVSERVIHIWQVMGLLPPVLFIPWDFDYIDRFKLEDVKPSYYASVHRTFIDGLESLNKFRFPDYMFQKSEFVKPYLMATDFSLVNGYTFHDFIDLLSPGRRIKKFNLRLTSSALCVAHDPPSQRHLQDVLALALIEKYHV